MSNRETNARLQQLATECVAVLSAAGVKSPTMATIGGILVHRVAVANRSPQVLRLVSQELSQMADDLERQLSLAVDVKRLAAVDSYLKNQI